LEIKILTEALDEDGEKRIGFSVEGSLGTQIELFKQTGGQIVTDVYHEEKTLLFDHANTEIMTVCGCGSGDTSIREIMNIPDNLGEINEIVYGIWNIENIETDIEPGKGVVSGFAKFKLLCQIGEEEKEYYVAEQQVPFRVSMEIVGVNENMELSADVQLKNVWFDKINGKQAEVNGGISVSAIVYEQREYETIENPAFLMCESDEKNIPSIVLYIVKPGDSLWKIAKLFKTTVDAIKDVNELESDMIMAGSKLLIVR